MRARLFLAGAFLLAAVTAGAAAEPLSAFLWKDAGPPTMAQPPAWFFRLGDLRGTLEKTTLAEVQRRFGGAIADNGKDAAGGESSLCYLLHTPAGTWRVTLASNHEMGGGTRILSVMLQPAEGSMTGCSPLPGPNMTFTVGQGIGAGMTVAGLLRRLGKPSARAGDPLHGRGRMSFAYDKPVAAHDPSLIPADVARLRRKGFSVLNMLQVQFSDGRVTAFAAQRVTSN